MAAPANDNFANASEVFITGGVAYEPPLVSNAEATTEAGEPTGVAYSNQKSCWWKYTPTSNGLARFDTQRSTTAGSGVDTQIAVYTGTWGNLSVVASNSDSGFGTDPDGYPGGGIGTSRIRDLSVSAGTTYYIQVGAWQGRVMNYGLRVVGPDTAAPPAPSGTVGGKFQALTGSLAATALEPPPVGDLLGQFPVLEGAFSATGLVAGSLGGVFPALTGAAAGEVTPLVETSTVYANDGYNYAGVGAVDYDPPIAATPARVRRGKVQRVHQSLPAPTLVDGRPV